MQLNPSEISELLKGRIQNLGVSTELRTQGTVVTVTDGICRVHGLSDVMQGEMLEFPALTSTSRRVTRSRRPGAFSRCPSALN
jgi:F-type H+-transporting ATPase subunit alpha